MLAISFLGGIEPAKTQMLFFVKSNSIFIVITLPSVVIASHRLASVTAGITIYNKLSFSTVAKGVRSNLILKGIAELALSVALNARRNEGSLYKLKRPCIGFASAFSLATAMLLATTGASDK